MLIDRIDRKLLKNVMVDAAIGTIFYVDESTYDFGSPGSFSGKTTDDIPLPQWLPYDSFMLHLSDGFITYYANEDQAGLRRIISDSFSVDKYGRIGHVFPGHNIVSYNFINNDLNLYSLSSIDRDSFSERLVSNSEIAKHHAPERFLLQYYILYQFLSFLSCKNVATEDIVPPEKLQRKRKKKNKPPLVSYKVLKLQNVASVQGTGPGQTGLWSNRIHLCRGHVREYTPDRPGLGGKLVGRYWIPPHVRGNRKLGAVRKDYALCT